MMRSKCPGLPRRSFLKAAAIVSTMGLMGSAAFAQRRVLKVGDMNSMGNRALLEAAGLLDGLTYEIEWNKFPSGAPELEALNAGAIDFGQVGDVAVLFAYAAGVPVRAIHTIAFQPDQMVLLVQKTSTASDITSLKGKRIAVNKGGGGHLLVLALLERAGMSARDVTFAFLGPNDAKAAFANGSVDAWSVWPHYSTLAIEQDGARQIANLSDVQGLYAADEYHIVNSNALEHKRDLIEDFNRRLILARQWSLTHVDEASALIARETTMPVALVKRIRLDLKPTPTPVTASTITGLQTSADIFTRQGVIPAVKVDGLFEPRLG